MAKLAALVWGFAAACSGGGGKTVDAAHDTATPDALAGTSHLTLQLSRAPTGSQIAVLVRAIAADGEPATGRGPVTLMAGPSAQSVPEVGAGSYAATIDPPFASGELTVVAAMPGFRSATATPVVIPTIDASWDLAERVPGQVNTPGWEDSVEISPDGEWLVLMYTPIDLVCCAFGGVACGGTTAGDPASPRCEDSLGPYQAPDRPNLPGAERIASTTHIVDACATVGLTGQQSFVLPPIGLYGFHRQPDGSFADPFPITFGGDDGCVSPFGVSFVGAPVGNVARVVMAWNDPRDYGANDTGNDIYSATLTLGQPATLGTALYNPVTHTIDISSLLSRIQAPSLAGNQGNPHYGTPWLWTDDDESVAEKDLFVATGSSLGGAFGATVKAAISESGRSEIQPFADGARLYYTVNTVSIASANLTGANPAQAGAWSAERLDLATAPEARVGAVVAIGEPSVAHTPDGTWLYFIYVLSTPTGLNANVGRIRAR